MKILFYGDSITDASRIYDAPISSVASYGVGYVRAIAGALLSKYPKKHTIINRGISGNRIVDLYSRIKIDAWNHEPDLISILIGINDIWHELARQNGVELDRFEKVYRMIIEDTLKKLPNVKIILCEPFVLKGLATEEQLEGFLEVKKYAKVVEKLAKEYNLYYIPLQEDFDKVAKEYGAEYYLSDGVHPNIAGAQLIADKWVELFEKEFGEE